MNKKLRSIVSFENWHLTRILQLVFGGFLVGSYFFYHADNFTLAIGGFLLMQAVFNISCVTGACAVQNARRPASSAGKAEAPQVEYEEIVD